MFAFAVLTALALPKQVDLRKGYEDYGLTVCRQNGPLCWDYTVVGLLEYELATQRHAAIRLSPGFLSWAAVATDAESRAGSNFGRASRGLDKFGIAPLSLGGDPDAEGRGATPGEATLQAAKELGRIDVKWIRFWDVSRELTDDQQATIKKEIAEGHPVAVGMRWPNQTRFASNFVLRVPPKGQVFDGHCVALVGYKDDPTLPGGGAYLFRNSWGDNWADHGYAWMPYDLLKVCVNDALSVRIAPPVSPASSDAKTFEAEDLPVKRVSGPAPVVQAVTLRGRKWGGGRQLLFQPSKVGDTYSIDVPVPRAGRYEVRLLITKGPDFGSFRAQINKDGTTIDAASPGLTRSREIPVATVQLKSGTARLTVTATGPGSASSGSLVGLDQIELIPR